MRFRDGNRGKNSPKGTGDQGGRVHLVADGEMFLLFKTTFSTPPSWMTVGQS